MGLEMRKNRVDCLLGPGMNLHRHPLNGRNFEYFSEDPYLTGMIACAELRGLQASGVTGTIKHFCGNNQETNRHFLNDVVSERALRELYLKGFEIAVKKGAANSIMTTYGAVNGVWTAGCYDLNTQILRKEWKFTGFTMSDWWANINRRGQEPDKRDFAAMVQAQNDVYMVCADSTDHDDNLMEALKDGTLKRSELQRSASNICQFLLNSNCMKRMLNPCEEVAIHNRPADAEQDDVPVSYYEVDRSLTIPLHEVAATRGSHFSFVLTLRHRGTYRITLTASSEQSPLAQLPVTLFSMGTACAGFTWNGTGGKPVSYEKELMLFSNYTTMRLYFGQSGLNMHEISFELLKEGAEPVSVSETNIPEEFD